MAGEGAISEFSPPARCEESTVRYSRISCASKVSSAKARMTATWMLDEAGQPIA
jgi:hypothetical protein